MQHNEFIFKRMEEELSNMALQRRYTIRDRGFYVDGEMYFEMEEGTRTFHID